MDRKKLLILSYSPLHTDPRILRQIAALKEDFDIVTAGFTAVEDSSIIFHSIYTEPPASLKRKIKRGLQFLTRSYDKFYWDSGKLDVLQILKKYEFDVVIANDIQTLPLALAVADNKSKVYFDAHEYHPREFDDNLKWRIVNKPYVDFLCKKYIPKADAFSTVCESLAVEYEKFVGKKPFVVTNATGFQDLSPSHSNSGKIRMIHHTAAIRSRKLELMIETMKYLDNRFSLDLILVGNDLEYIKELKQLAAGKENVRFVPPVPFREIPSFINSYDMGIIIWAPTNFNYLYGLPNKFFEFIQARLAIAVSPNPEIANLVRKYELGVVADDYTAEAMAKAIKDLTEEKITHYKKQSHLAAKELSAERNIQKIKSVIADLVS